MMADSWIAHSIWSCSNATLVSFNDAFMVLTQQSKAVLSLGSFHCTNLMSPWVTAWQIAHCCFLWEECLRGRLRSCRMLHSWMVQGVELPFLSSIEALRDNFGSVAAVSVSTVPITEMGDDAHNLRDLYFVMQSPVYADERKEEACGWGWGARAVRPRCVESTCRVRGETTRMRAAVEAAEERGVGRRGSSWERTRRHE
eukprot:TRINITY_DN1302_c1_g2_i4.p2 TRINITY_DN1302_c1_g2~~TRINITY_DN1302_c1_g2_i4.p2  ORF type:complete len:199 (-),score=43.29 TRINITY_DN1302_c1_g2_i4:1077-1673(-)